MEPEEGHHQTQHGKPNNESSPNGRFIIAINSWVYHINPPVSSKPVCPISHETRFEQKLLHMFLRLGNNTAE